MLSPLAVKIISNLPEGLVLPVTKKITERYLKKYANVVVEDFDKVDKVEGTKIFICNHLSNSDGLILNKILKEKYDPYFIAGVKLDDDSITRLGAMLVKRIEIKPNSPDKDSITKIVKAIKDGNNILIFPEGTRSRTGGMIEGKKGILLFARLTKAKIIPIGMSGTDILLPVNTSGDMGAETWNKADVVVKFGDPVEFPKKEEGENKHDYDDRCMYTLMKSIANLLPEKYRGVYK